MNCGITKASHYSSWPYVYVKKLVWSLNQWLSDLCYLTCHFISSWFPPDFTFKIWWNINRIEHLNREDKVSNSSKQRDQIVYDGKRLFLCTTGPRIPKEFTRVVKLYFYWQNNSDLGCLWHPSISLCVSDTWSKKGKHKSIGAKWDKE